MPSSDLIRPQAGTAVGIHTCKHEKFFQRTKILGFNILPCRLNRHPPHCCSLSLTFPCSPFHHSRQTVSMQVWLLWNMPYRAEQSHTSVDPPALASQNLGIRHKPSFLNAQSLFIGGRGEWLERWLSNNRGPGFNFQHPHWWLTTVYNFSSRESYVLFYLQGYCMHVVKHPYTQNKNLKN